jgi:phosphatidylinositol-binding clathrin assembly protein
VLGHFFEMSKPDAERAMDIYRTFTKQTDYVVQYLAVARQHEHHTRVEVPKLKHAPVNLGRQLEEYLSDPDFEVHRRQYLAELDAKKSGKGGSSSSALRSFKSDTTTKPASNNPFPSVNGSGSTSATAKPSKGPDVDLIDFFESIEQNQTPMATQPNPAAVAQGQQQWAVNPGFQAQPIVTGFASNGFAQPQQVPQPTGFNPFSQQQQQPQVQQQQQTMGTFSQQQQVQQPLQPAFTGAGFGGYTPQPQLSFQPSTLGSIPQDSVASFSGAPSPFQSVQPTGQANSNPFRQSQMVTGPGTMPIMPGVTGATQSPVPSQNPSATFSPITSPLNRQNTNPFARSSPQTTQTFGVPANNSPFQSTASQQPPAPAAAPLQPMATGTNPFAKNFGSPQPAEQQQRPVTSGAIMPQATGTNPFRQGAFVNHDTGMGWQHQQQRIGGGLDDLQTIPAFPRPAQQSPWQS